MTPEPVWQQHGPWRLLIAPEWQVPAFVEALLSLPYLIESQGQPLKAPDRHRVDRLELPGPAAPQAVVVKTFGPQPFWHDHYAARAGSKAERAFRTARALAAAGVGTPPPLAVVERWEGARLRDCRLVTAFVPDLTNLRDELQRIYAEAPFCAPLMDLLQATADAVRAFHDAGFLHRDLGNQNIGLQRASPTPWKVFFLDLNRARRQPNPSPAERGADLARLDLPSDFRRVFHAMYFHGYSPPPEFTRAEQKARRAFARHTALRPLRHPLREARLRRRETGQQKPLRGREIWIWDDRSAQAIPAYTPSDRRALLPASNFTAALRSAAQKGWAIHRAYRRYLAASFCSPIPFAGALGLALEPDPATWALQLEFLRRLQGARKIPLLLRLYHHQNPDGWHWTLDQALHLHRQGHPVAFALVQDRRAIREVKGWRHMTTLALDRAHSFADFFEIGHAVNRSKWGLWDFREYGRLLEPLHACLIEHPETRLAGPACIDFEPQALAAILELLPRPLPLQLFSHHLYVDRRGAPENRQGPFDVVGKCALLRAIARAYGFADDRLIISEVNWPLQGTGPWSPVTSPYETRDPRQNDPSVEEETYAAYMVRYLLLTLASGHVQRVYWWRLAARGFGLVDDTDPAAWRPRPAFFSFQQLLEKTADATFSRRLPADAGEYALEFTRPGAAPLIVRWTLASAPVWSS